MLWGVADELTVQFPWGSLLHGMLGRDDAVLAGVARLLAPRGTATALVSVVPHDGLPAIPPRPALAAAYARHGLQLVEARPAADPEVAAASSSWAKRLGAGSRRPVTRLRLGH